MNNNLIVKLDLNDIDTYEKFIDKLNDAFEFVDWFGKNTSATIDCLSSIYFGEEQALAKIRNVFERVGSMYLSKVNFGYQFYYNSFSKLLLLFFNILR